MIRFLPQRILAAAVLLALVLAGLVIHESRARAAGQEVRLPMEAVDPRSLLGGHYVALQLTQAMAAGQPCPPGLPQGPRPGWIALVRTPTGERVGGGGATRAEALTHGVIALKGRADCYAAPASGEFPGRITLKIGVDRFHADQKQAQALDAALRGRTPNAPDQAFAVVSVGQDGKARLKGVIVGGQRADLTWD
jgi:hypothetical protein